MPLAIELAAGATRRHTCEDIARQIEENMDSLATTMRDVPARHRSIRAVFEHSWHLLARDERSVLAALSVFRGGFQPDAAAHVACASPACLAHLVAKSLLRRNLAGRYDLHQLVRQYAEEKLGEAGAIEQVRNRHLRHFLALAEAAAPKLHGDEQVAWLDRLEAEHNNLRAALQWSATAPGRASFGLRLATALEPFWYMRGYWHEGRTWLAQALSLATGPTAHRAAALNAGGFLALEQGDIASAALLLESGLALFQALEIPAGVAWALYHLALITVKRAGHLHARAICETSVALFQESGERRGSAWALLRLAGIVGFLGDYEREVMLCEESLAIFRELGERQGTIDALHFLGRIAQWTGNEARAAALYAEALALARALRQKHGIADMLTSLGNLAYNQGDYQRASVWLAEALPLY
jgi:tetratricopeptide (TPR) repeat protein